MPGMLMFAGRGYDCEPFFRKIRMSLIRTITARLSGVFLSLLLPMPTRSGSSA
jgi:hypothetical protein